MSTKILLVGVTLLLTACATQLTDQGGKVRLVTAEQAGKCQQIKIIMQHSNVGPDKTGNAMRSALNDAAAVGANALYVVSSTMASTDGASVLGNALRCEQL